VLATVAGDAADARAVVLREVDRGGRRLLVFTDARSPKVAQLRAHPLGMLVAWSPELTWQVRLKVAISVETEGLAAASRWARLRLSRAAQDYQSPLPPGTRLDGAPAFPSGPVVADRCHFAVLQAQVLSVDWLELHAEGHRRAMFDAQGARWLAP
jgi:hypothetical protein